MKAVEQARISPNNSVYLLPVAPAAINQNSVPVFRNAVNQTEPKASFQNYTVNQIQDLALQERIQNLRTVPEVFCCPVTLELMEDPCINDSASGRSYEKRVLEEILEKGDRLDPITRQPFTIILQNRTLKEAIEEWKKSELELINNEPRQAPVLAAKEAQAPIVNDVLPAAQIVANRVPATPPSSVSTKSSERLGDKIEAKIDKFDDNVSKVTRKLEHSFKKRFRF
jgi:hypothetical protein